MGSWKLEARITISNDSEGTKQSSKTDMSISTTQGGLSTSDLATLEKYQQQSRLEIIIDRTNTDRKLGSYTVKEMDGAVRSFADDIRKSNSPVITSFKTYSYDSLLAEAFKDRVSNPFPDWAVKLSSNFRYVRQLIELKSNLICIKGNQQNFVYQDEQELKDALAKLDDILDRNRAWWMKCLSSKGALCSGEPERLYVVKAPKFGSSISELDPTTCSPQFIGRAMDTSLRVELYGRYKPKKAEWSDVPVYQLAFLVYRDLISGKQTELTAPTSYTVTPVNSDIYYHLRDHDGNPNKITCWNNHVFPKNPARAKVGEALNLNYIKNYSLPPI